VAAAGRELHALEEDAAIGLITSQLDSKLGEAVEEGDALAVGKRVSYLPLGLQASIGLIMERRCSLKDYLHQWNSPRALIHDLEPKHVFMPFAKYDKGHSEVYSGVLTHWTRTQML